MKTLSVLLFTLFSIQAFASSHPPMEFLQQRVQTVNWDTSISRSVIINAPISEVWDYASDSNRAIDWSVYFDHISPLEGPKDGTIGSMRRCFRNADETGERWDEVTIASTPLESRYIVTFNFINYPLNFIGQGKYAFVRQLYRAIDKDHTEMTFQTQLAPGSGIAWGLIFKYSSRDTGHIFQLNLENIKAAIEGNPRPYPWE